MGPNLLHNIPAGIAPVSAPNAINATIQVLSSLVILNFVLVRSSKGKADEDHDRHCPTENALNVPIEKLYIML